jgi:hypothetical protein
VNAAGALRVPASIVAACFFIVLVACASAPHAPPRNVVIFVADGLRHDSVNATDAPTLLAARTRGVHFLNSHSLFPTVTTANAAAIATGHYLGDTGDFSNTEYVGAPIFSSGSFGKTPGTPAPFLESDQVLADLDDRFAPESFLGAQGLLALARARGFNTAAIGKLGPVAIQDLTHVGTREGRFLTPQTVILDDATGTEAGLPLSPQALEALQAAGLEPAAPPRVQPAGGFATAGTLEANVVQQKWLVDAATKAILPAFVRSGRPFVLVYWSRDPDGTQHNQGDSLNRLDPGINGPTSRAAIANADANLRQILDYLDSQPALRANTDVFITSDHGFATISKHEIDAHGRPATSYAATFSYRDAHGAPEVGPGWLPAGFLAIDLAHALDLPLFDADNPVHKNGTTHYVPVDPAKPTSPASRQRPVGGNALIGGSATQGESPARLIVATNGGSDLIYIPDGDRSLAGRAVEFLVRQDYVGALFVDSRLGRFPGALTLADIALEGDARMPRPAIVVSFTTFLRQRGDLRSAVQIADTPLQEGQGSHGSLARDNTFNNMAAFGPDFRQGFSDPLPASNADIAPTVAHILGLRLPARGALQGRVLSEALNGGKLPPTPVPRPVISAAGPDGKATAVWFQELDGRRYFDAACRLDVSATHAATTALCPDASEVSLH